MAVSELIFVIVAVIALTFVQRIAGYLIVKKFKNIPDGVKIALKCIPVAVFGALILPAMLSIKKDEIPSIHNIVSKEIVCSIILFALFRFMKKPYFAFAIAAIIYVILSFII